MRNSLWGYLIAIAVGGLSQLVRDPSWLGPALLCLAFVIALLATAGLARDSGWLSRLAEILRRRRSGPVEPQPSDGQRPAKTASRVQVPRPAGPAGPVPVLQKQPKTVTGDAPGAASGPSPQGPANTE
jgi:hypothetical protein